MHTVRTSQRTFIAAVALVLGLSTAATIQMCRSMSSMADMHMPGGWSMSGVWMPMPNQTWLGAAGSFLLMWTLMMVPMMLPSLAPMLSRYRDSSVGVDQNRLDALTAIVGAGYFFVWAAIGLAVFALGMEVSKVEMQRSDLSRCVPVAVGAMLLVIGALQFTPWKERSLACCRELPDGRMPPWGLGLRLGLRCVSCCFGLMAIQTALGIMDLRLMAVVTLAITAERLAPNGWMVARGIGWVVVAAGLYLIVRAV